MRRLGKIATFLLLIGILLPAVPAESQIRTGEWFCISAMQDNAPLPGFRGSINMMADEFTAEFTYGTDNGSSQSLYVIEAESLLVNRIPQEVILHGSRSSYGTRQIYEIALNCSEETWALVQASLGYGWPEGATQSRVIFKQQGDSVLVIKSPDGKTVFTYTYGSLRPLNNPVQFQVNMKIQRQLGNFNPQDGDIVVVRGDFNNWTGNEDLMSETATSGIYSLTRNFSGDQIGVEQLFHYVIVRPAGTEQAEADPKRSFVLEPFGQVLGTVFFDRRARPDVVENIAIGTTESDDYSPATAYNPYLDEFLVVWSKNLEDLWGNLVNADGTKGTPFPVVASAGNQRNPSVDFNPVDKEYIVVFQDDRNQDWDIYGVRLDENGEKLPSENQQADSTFIICDQVQAQTSPRVAVNTLRNTCLTVWVDQRNTLQAMTEVDIYGQRLGPGGKLIVSEGSPDTKVNIPIAAYPQITEYYPDVAYHGQNGKILDEWLVVYTRSYAETHDMGANVWGVRIKGVNCKRMNTFGEEIAGIGKASRIQGGGPPWFPDFPIGYTYYSPDYSFTYQGSPHVESNDRYEPGVMLKTTGIYEYPVPEFFVAWSEFKYGTTQVADIYGQRIAFFPDSTAFRMGLKAEAGPDSQYTAVPLDEFGNWELPPGWFPGPNVHVCNNEYYQSYNNISYDQNYGAYLVVWNDWRSTFWDGTWGTDEGWVRPPADIYGQRLWLNPADTSMAWLDHDGTDGAPPDLNTPIAFLEAADEGNSEYPAVAHSSQSDKFLVAYEYDDYLDGIDVYGNLYQGTPPIRVGVENRGDAAVLRDFNLLQNWPNPFNPVTEITYSIGRTGRVDLAIYNTRGQKILDLCEKIQNPGTYHASWDGKDASGINVPSGIYLYRLSFNGFEISKKMALVR